MSPRPTPVHPSAAAHNRVLYQVVHLTDMDLDEWTQDYGRAAAIFARFVRDYGGAHLHVAILHAGQYGAVCLHHIDMEASA